MTLPLTLRIHRPDSEENSDQLVADPIRLAAEELLRPAGPRTAGRTPGRDLEPFSRAWYEELEQTRYAGPGAWLRRTLEFTRHADDTLLMLGPGTGSDAAQYHRHGTRVTVCVTPTDPPVVARQAFQTRGLPIPVLHAATPHALPFDAGRFDLAYLNLLALPTPDLASTAAELYRVLKPGGKVFVLAPARFDAPFFGRLLHPWRRATPRPAEVHTSHSLRTTFPQFTEPATCKRHLRPADLPPLWRWMPASLLSRVAGRVVVFKAFKPVSAAYLQVPVHAA